MVETIDTTSKGRILDENTFQLGDRIKFIVAVLFKNGMEGCNSGVLRFLGFRAEWGMAFGLDKESK